MPTLPLVYWTTFRQLISAVLWKWHCSLLEILCLCKPALSQTETGIQNLPSERDGKLGSLFRPAIKTKVMKDFSLAHLLQRERRFRLQAGELSLCHCSTSYSHKVIHATGIAGAHLLCSLDLRHSLWHHKPYCIVALSVSSLPQLGEIREP